MMGTPTLWIPVGSSYPHPSKFFRKIPGTRYRSSISLNVSAEVGTRVPLAVTLCRSRRVGAEVLPSVPSSVVARLRLRFTPEDESSGPWSEPSLSDVLCLGLVLEDREWASCLEGDGVDLDFSPRAYLKKSRASGSSPFPLLTDLTPFVVDEGPFYTDELTDNDPPIEFRTDSEEFNIRLESILVETCPTSGKYLECLH